MVDIIKQNGAKAPTPKREMMARLYAERKAAGLQKCSFWLTEDQRESVNKFIASINTSTKASAP